MLDARSEAHTPNSKLLRLSSPEPILERISVVMIEVNTQYLTKSRVMPISTMLASKFRNVTNYAVTICLSIFLFSGLLTKEGFAQKVALIGNTQASVSWRVDLDSINVYLDELNLDTQNFNISDVTADSIAGFDLVIWNDLSWTSFGIRDQQVALFSEIHDQGTPLYFIGDDLANASNFLADSMKTVWSGLIHLDNHSNTGSESQIVFSNNQHPVSNGVFGMVGDYTYTFDTDVASATNTGETVLAATTDGSPTVLVFESATGTRVVTQNNLVAIGGDAQSIFERDKLFKNAVSWLLNLTVTSSEDEVPNDFSLAEIYPNPFNPSTTLSVDLQRSQDLRIYVVDQLGRRVKSVFDGPLSANKHQFTIELVNLPSGLYHVVLESDNFTTVKPAVLLK